MARSNLRASSTVGLSTFLVMYAMNVSRSGLPLLAMNRIFAVTECISLIWAWDSMGGRSELVKRYSAAGDVGVTSRVAYAAVSSVRPDDLVTSSNTDACSKCYIHLMSQTTN